MHSAAMRPNNNDNLICGVKLNSVEEISAVKGVLLVQECIQAGCSSLSGVS